MRQCGSNVRVQPSVSPPDRTVADAATLDAHKGHRAVYQIEIKAQLVSKMFPPARGWRVTVDLDAMELARGGQHPADKQAIAQRVKEQLEGLGANLGSHPKYGRVDLVAEKQGEPTWLVEVEGDSRRQREQALYSALGQLVLRMEKATAPMNYALAVPASENWRRQARKIPARVLNLLNLSVLLVSPDVVVKIDGTGESPL